jgi:polyphosphate kinase 2 (PPK2 family)
MGDIGIFNRSQYEDVLVVRVHKMVPKSVWSERYQQINAFEQSLVENNVTILKFFLHISKDEQKNRFEERMQDPKKNWKLSLPDFEERKHWDDYIKAYEAVLRKCSTEWAPWYVIPANDKWFRNYAISSIIVRTLEKMNLKYPPVTIDLSKVSLD